MKRFILALVPLLVLIPLLCSCLFLINRDEDISTQSEKTMYDIGLAVYAPEANLEVEYCRYELNILNTSTSAFPSRVYPEHYHYYGYYTEPNGQGIKICDENNIVTKEFADFVISTNGSFTYFAYPLCSLKESIVTFVTGTNQIIEPKKYFVNDKIELPECDEIVGYTFEGWAEWENGVPQQELYCTSENTTLYAIYRANEYYFKCYSEDGVGFSSHRVTYDSDYSISFAEKSEYNFMGCYSEPNGKGIKYIDKNGKSIAPWTITDESTDMYKFYVKAPYYTITVPNTSIITKLTVTFKSCTERGEERLDEVVTYRTNDIVEYRVPSTPRGHMFEGWYTDANLQHKFSFTEKVTKDLTLYPKFKKVADATGAIPVFEIGNHSVELEPSTNSRYVISYMFQYDGDMELTVGVNDPSVYDLEATVWVENKTDETQIMAPTRLTNDMDKTFNLSVKRGDIIAVYATHTFADSMPGKPVYLFARVSGGENPKSRSRVAIPTEFTFQATSGNSFRIDVIERLGYTFVGYYTEPGGKGTKITDEKGRSYGKYDFDSDTTLYAYYIDT